MHIFIVFSWVLRSQKVLAIERRDINIKINSDSEYLELHIRKSKTDQYNRGNLIVLPAIQDPSCLLKLTKRYLQIVGLMKAKNSTQKVFCNLGPYPDKLEFSKPLTYGRFRKIFCEALASANCAKSSALSCHSLRIGGASHAVQKIVPKHLVKKHGRWLTDNVFEFYCRNSLAQQLF